MCFGKLLCEVKKYDIAQEDAIVGKRGFSKGKCYLHAPRSCGAQKQFQIGTKLNDDGVAFSLDKLLEPFLYY